MDKSFLQSSYPDKVIKEMALVAGYLWAKGWAERNAGNISVNVTGHVETGQAELVSFPEKKLEKAYPSLAGAFILLSGTGTRMRDLKGDPAGNTCMIRITDDGKGFQKLDDGTVRDKLQPTSELPTHLAIHEMLVIRNAGEKAVVHTHVNELIALTHIKKFTDEKAINDLLWAMHPETVVFVPHGIGFVPYCLPGSEKIAGATIKALEDHNVILWEKHGCLAIGDDVQDAFDQIDILAKSAQIYFLCKSAGFEPQGMNRKDLDEIRKNYLKDIF